MSGVVKIEITESPETLKTLLAQQKTATEKERVQAGTTRQLTLVPFTLTGLPQHSNLVLGVILSILSFVGFESATTLGEEVQ